MKKFLILISLFLFSGENILCAKVANSKRAGSAKRSGSSRRSVASLRSAMSKDASQTLSSSETEEKVKEEDKFISCMDNFCKSSSDEDKGRCRCSSQLTRIEKILRDIDKIQNEADAQNKNMETLMNVSNTAIVDDSIGNVYDNINSIEKKAKNLSGKRLDGKTMVMEGYPLYKKAYEECKTHLPTGDGLSTKKEQEYQTMIESDCSAYTTVLKEKADTAQNLLVQAQKNQEMFEEQQHKQLNQLDTSSCYVEYENCMKTQCGEEYKFCKESTKLEANFKKCQSINYGKCEENKVVVIKDLKKTIKKAFAKAEVAQSCLSAMGHIMNGKCIFKVRYIADGCTSAKNCGQSQEKQFNPGYTVTCEDRRGDFKDLVSGCKESCYIIGPNDEEKFIGTNRETDGGKNAKKVGLAIITLGISAINSNTLPGCKSDGDLDRYTLPTPAGWGSDGYPVHPELKNAF